MKVLFFKPFWVYNPRIASVLDNMQENINIGHQVALVTCNGELRKGCIDNPLKSKQACKACIYFRKKDLSLLSEPIETHTISEFLSKKMNYEGLVWNYNNAKEIKNVMYKGVDVGYAALSGYVQLTRNQSPKVDRDFRLFFNGMLNAGAMLTDAAFKAIEQLKPEATAVFNGRIHTRRPVLRVSQQLNIACNVYEHTGMLGSSPCKKMHFENCLPQDVGFNTKLIYDTWEKSVLTEEQKVAKAEGFYLNKKAGINMDDRSYTKSQNMQELPENWDNTKRNVVIFNSSDDEFASLGEEWEYHIAETRLQSIKTLVEHFKTNEKFHFYLRVHPNLKGLNYNYVSEIFKLSVYKNLSIIPSESSISSYLLLSKAEKVITFGSTMGIESVYFGVPSILLGNSLYARLGGNYKAESHAELFALVESKLEPKDIKPALLYAFFRMNMGAAFKYFDPNYYSRFELKIGGKLLFSMNKNYREKMYSGFLAPFWNLVNYKRYSIPKNIWKKVNKQYIPKLEE